MQRISSPVRPGFIGSHLSEALVAGGHDVVGLDCFTDYYDVELKEENARGTRRPAPRPRARPDRPRRASTGSSTSRGSRACAASAMSSRPTSTGMCSPRSELFEAAARDGVRVVFASSSSIYGEAEALPDRRDVGPRPVSPYGITKLDLRAPRPRDRAQLRPRRRRRSATSTPTARASGPTWRSRASRCASPRVARSTCSATVTSRAASRTSATSSAATIAAMEGGRGHVQRRRRRGGDDARDDRDPRGARRAGRSRSARHPAVPGDQRRTKADTSLIRAELGWEPATTLRDGLAAQWEWAAARVAAR